MNFLQKLLLCSKLNWFLKGYFRGRQLYAARHNLCCRKKVNCPFCRLRASSLFVSQRLSVPERSCSISLVWALSLPWGVWVLHHKTVNPPYPDSYWLCIHILPLAQKKAALASTFSLLLIIPRSLFMLHFYQQALTQIWQYIIHDTGTALHFFLSTSSVK